MTATRKASDSVTILIVDDDEEVAESYANVLSPEYTVQIATGGEAGLEAVDADIDVVLLDRRMPDVTGDELLAEIRSRGYDGRVVMVTAIDPDTDIISLDFDDYLVKPVGAEDLRDAVERMVARNHLEANLHEAFSLASKMATLEAKMDIEELEQSDEYAALESRFAEFRELFSEIDANTDLFAKLSRTKMEALFAEN